MVDRSGRRFCDDAFPGAITAAALGDGGKRHLPFYMVWDDRHRQRYGLAEVWPGEHYQPGTVVSADSLDGLGAALGIDGNRLAQTVAEYNHHAREGRDPLFQRGSIPWSQKFKGDVRHRPHPNIDTIEAPPFHGIRLRLTMTGIPAAGVAVTTHGRVVDPEGRVIPGVYAAGAATAMAGRGASYNSGFSLSTGLVSGVLAARHAATNQSNGS